MKKEYTGKSYISNAAESYITVLDTIAVGVRKNKIEVSDSEILRSAEMCWQTIMLNIREESKK